MVRFNLVITLLLMINMAVKAELTNRMFDIRHVGYAEGLSSQRVFSIVEDGDGAMWIATKTGIDRYNGHTVKNYDLPGVSIMAILPDAGFTYCTMHNKDCLPTTTPDESTDIPPSWIILNKSSTWDN